MLRFCLRASNTCVPSLACCKTYTIYSNLAIGCYIGVQGHVKAGSRGTHAVGSNFLYKSKVSGAATHTELALISPWLSLSLTFLFQFATRTQVTCLSFRLSSPNPTIPCYSCFEQTRLPLGCYSKFPISSLPSRFISFPSISYQEVVSNR